jgi:hypothetical protein
VSTTHEIAAHVRAHGGATVTIHGRTDIMGDEFEDRTYVVGGAVDANGEVFNEVLTQFGVNHERDAEDVQRILREARERTRPNDYVALGFWVDDRFPDGHVEVDLVNVTTLYSMASQWAEERHGDAFYEMTTDTLYFTDHFLETQQRLIREELMAEAVGE